MKAIWFAKHAAVRIKRFLRFITDTGRPYFGLRGV
jgi:hypothetical protein